MSRHTDILYGIHVIRHALQQHPESVLELWVQQGRDDGGETGQILKLARQAGLSIQIAPKATLEKLAGSAVHQGVVARARADYAAAPDLDSVLAATADQKRLFLLLDGVQDPHNLGACLRTANAAGVDAVILPKDRAAAVTPVVRKVASGAAEATPVISVTNLSRTLRELQEAGVWIVGMDGSAEKSLYDLDLEIPLALVLGAEGEGLRENTRKHCDYLARLPMQGTVESLNVSVAAGVCLYEAVRQRKRK